MELNTLIQLGPNPIGPLEQTDKESCGDVDVDVGDRAANVGKSGSLEHVGGRPAGPIADSASRPLLQILPVDRPDLFVTTIYEGGAKNEASACRLPARKKGSLIGYVAVVAN